MKRCSVIDIGTNSLLYLMVEMTDTGKFCPREQKLYNIRLGRGLSKNKKIEDAALGRCIEILIKLKQEAIHQKTDKMIAVGTEVFRRAENREQILLKIKNHTGLKVKVLTEREEAEASFSGAVTRTNLHKECWVADVGGGSSEVIYGKQDEIFDYISLPLGAVGLTEEFLHTDPPASREIYDLENKVNTEIKKCFFSSWIPRKKLIGVGGTITTAAAIHYQLKKYDPDYIQGKILKLTHINSILRRLCRVTQQEREKIVSFDPERADIITAGMIIVKSIMKLGKFNSVMISDSGLRFGLAVRELTS